MFPILCLVLLVQSRMFFLFFFNHSTALLWQRSSQGRYQKHNNCMASCLGQRKLTNREWITVQLVSSLTGSTESKPNRRQLYETFPFGEYSLPRPNKRILNKMSSNLRRKKWVQLVNLFKFWHSFVFVTFWAGLDDFYSKLFTFEVNSM